MRVVWLTDVSLLRAALSKSACSTIAGRPGRGLAVVVFGGRIARSRIANFYLHQNAVAAYCAQGVLQTTAMVTATVAVAAVTAYIVQGRGCYGVGPP